MAPSSEQSMTLEQAADVLALHARIGLSRSPRSKSAMASTAGAGAGANVGGQYGVDNSGMTGMLLGGGLGLGAGLLSSAMTKDRRKRWLRNALLGSAMGAGVGGALGYGSQLASQLGKPSPDTDYTSYLQSLKDKTKSPITDPVGSAIGRLYSAATGNTAEWPADVKAKAPHGYNFDSPDAPKPGVSTVSDITSEYIGRPVTTAFTTGAGAIGGHFVDKSRVGQFENPMTRVRGLNEAGLKQLSKPSAAEAEQFIAGSKMPGANLDPMFKNVKLTRYLSAPVPTRLPGSTPGLNIPPSTGIGPSNRMTMSPQLREELFSKTKFPAKPGLMGKGVGAGLGLLSGPAIARLLSGSQQPATP